MLIFPSGVKRTEYLKKKKVYGAIGNNVMIQSRKIPLYPELIFFGDNVRVASNVLFITHDAIHNMLNNLPQVIESGNRIEEKKGKITIGNNVFIGANSIILYDTHIGNNVIIGAGSIVTKDIPEGTVCVGVPCKVIDSFDAFLERKKVSICK